MKVLLTGATGFIGRQVFLQLQKIGVHLKLILRENSNNQELPSNEKIEKIYTTDLFIEPPSWWESHCKDVDIVIHLAWYVEHGRYLHAIENIDCLHGTLSLAKGAAAAGIKRFIGIGTCLEYKLGSEVLSKNTPLDPLTPYAAAKAATYSTLTHYFKSLAITFSWCRLFYLYGEGEDKQRLHAYLKTQLAAGKVANLSDGSKIRDFLDVKVAAEKIIEIALKPKAGATNICSGIPVSIKEFAESVADEYGRRDLLLFDTKAPHSFDPPVIVGQP